LAQEDVEDVEDVDLPYSPDFTPCDLFLLSRLKGKLPGRRFQSVKEMVSATREAILDLPENNSQKCFQHLYQRFQTRVSANGDY
jgi:hypothetical protein